jgi:hypothetical protein
MANHRNEPAPNYDLPILQPGREPEVNPEVRKQRFAGARAMLSKIGKPSKGVPKPTADFDGGCMTRFFVSPRSSLRRRTATQLTTPMAAGLDESLRLVMGNLDWTLER